MPLGSEPWTNFKARQLQTCWQSLKHISGQVQRVLQKKASNEQGGRQFSIPPFTVSSQVVSRERERESAHKFPAMVRFREPKAAYRKPTCQEQSDKKRGNRMNDPSRESTVEHLLASYI